MRIHVRPTTPEIPVFVTFKPWSHRASASALTLVSNLENAYDADTLYGLYRYKFMWAITEQITYVVCVLFVLFDAQVGTTLSVFTGIIDDQARNTVLLTCIVYYLLF